MLAEDGEALVDDHGLDLGPAEIDTRAQEHVPHSTTSRASPATSGYARG
jgi:hypothetical protein